MQQSFCFRSIWLEDIRVWLAMGRIIANNRPPFIPHHGLILDNKLDDPSPVFLEPNPYTLFYIEHLQIGLLNQGFLVVYEAANNSRKAALSSRSRLG
jgi:hypothetical protein